MKTSREGAMATALGLLLAFGVLTLWVRSGWAQALVQCGICLLGLLCCPFLHRLSPPRLSLLTGLLGAAAVWAAVQALAGLSVSPWRSWNAARDWAVCAAAAALAGWSLAQPALRRRAQTAFLLFTLVLAIQAVLQLFTSAGLVYWSFPSGYETDVLGPFVYRNRFAQFIELAFPIALWRAVVEPRRRALYLTAAALLFSTVVAAASRAGFLVLTAETAAALALAWRRGFLGRREALWMAAQAALVLAGWSAVSGWSALGDRLFGLDPFEDKRLQILQSTLAMVAARPWSGWGLGAWSAAYPAFARFDAGVFVNQAHNDWLQWAAEGGVWFLLVPLAAAALTLRPALRSGWGLGVVAVFVHAFVDYPLQQVPVFAALVWGFAGFVTAGDAPGRRTVPEFHPPVRTVPIPMSRTTFLTLIAFLALAVAPLGAQTRPSPAWGPMGDAGAANLPGQKIGPNDLLAVSVYDAPELTRTLRVSADGYLRLPMTAKKIKADGLLPAELEREIAGLLSDEGLFVKPVVMVTVVEYNSRPVSVVGAVRRPLTFQAVGRVTLLDALARAEGLTGDAGPEILVTRPASDTGQRVTERIAVRELMDRAVGEKNLLLQGGEEIRVPEAGRIYVTGNVKKPGSFPVREGAELSVLKALALAEGLSPFPQKLAYLYRPAPDGTRQEIAVPLARIVQRKAADVTLRADDVLYIPEDAGKRTVSSVVDRLAGFGASTASGVLIWRR